MVVKPTYEELEKRVQEFEQAEDNRKRAMVSFRESEERHRMKLDNILLPEGDVGTLGLAEIMDTKSIQSLMDDFFSFSNIGVAIIDLNGKILVATGWQDICTQFHRVHPETCNNCHESDIHLSNDVEPGKFRLYRCKNNMWDIATPITVGGKRMGNLFLGQFIFSDELPDIEIFRSQAHKYGFNEKEYLSALERVPRWSREKVNAVMIFYAKLAHLISELSFGNIKLGRTLMERDNFLNSLTESEKNLRTTLDSIGDAVMASDKDGNIVRMNPVAERLTGWSEHDAAGKPFETVFRIINEVTRETVESPVKKVLSEGVTVGLANHTLLISKEGIDIPIADSCAPIKDNDGNVTGVVLVFRDQTEERAAQKALEESQERFMALHDASFGGICIHDKGIILDCNQGLSDMTGFAREELVGMNGLDLIAPEWRELVMQKILSGFEQSYDIEGLRKDGTIYFLRIQGKNIPYQGRSVRVTEFRDITEYKLAEEKIKRNESRLRRLLDILQHPSETIQDFLDYALDQAIQLTESKIGYIYHYHEDRKEFVLNTWSREVMAESAIANPLTCYELEKTGIWGEAVRQRRPIIVNDFQVANPLKKGYPEGHVQLKKFITIPIFKDDSIVGVIGLANKETDYEEPDILQVSLLMETVWKVTERKRAEDALRESEERFRKLFERHSAVMLVIDPDTGNIIDANEAAEKFYGWPLEVLKRMRIQQINMLPPEAVKTEMEKAALSGSAKFEFRHRRADGSIRDVEVFSNKIEIAGNGLLYSIVHDITDRKIQEGKIQKLNRTLTALVHSSEVMMRATDESAYLGEICDIIVKDCGHSMVWIGYAEDDAAKSVRPVVSSGFDAGYLESLEITWADTERGRGPTGTAIRTGRISTCSNMTTDPNFAPWCEEAHKRGYASSLVLPLMADGRCFGAISIYSCEQDSFSEEEINLLKELADDLAFGIMSMRLRIERTRTEESLRSLLKEKEVLLKEVHHRVKNNLQVISSLISLQSDSLPEEQMQLIFSDLRSRVHSIALVHEKLYISDDMGNLNFAEYATSLLKYLWRVGVTSAHNVRLNLSLEPLIFSIDLAVHCGLILNELTTNALKYAFPDGREGEVSVSLECDPATGAVCLRVRDNGIGLPADLDWRQFSSLGLRLVQMLTGQMHGTVQTGPGPGTEFQISFNVKGTSS